MLLIFIQYRVVIYRHGRQIHCADKSQNTNELSEIRSSAYMHAVNTCVNYVMFVWAVVFTKAFQGVHCIPRERLVLAQDLGLVH